MSYPTTSYDSVTASWAVDVAYGFPSPWMVSGAFADLTPLWDEASASWAGRTVLVDPGADQITASWVDAPIAIEQVVSSWLEVDDDLGTVYALAGMVANSASAAFDDGDLGIVYGVASSTLLSWLSVDEDLGLVYSRAYNFSDDWESRGFPPPLITSYSYTRDAGLVRTQMASGIVRQRRRWTSGYRTCEAQFTIPFETLFDIEQFLTHQGTDWFTMGLVTGDNDSLIRQPHTVRVVSDPEFSEVQGNNLSLALTLEVQTPYVPIETGFSLLRSLIVTISDEAQPIYVTDMTCTVPGTGWQTDVDAFYALTGGYSDRVLCLAVAQSNGSPGAVWPHAAGINPPCEIIDAPRCVPEIHLEGEPLTGDWLYEKIAGKFGEMPWKRDLYVFIDVSSSLVRADIEPAIDDFINDYAYRFNVIELSCTNERWLRWMVNAATGIEDCT